MADDLDREIRVGEVAKILGISESAVRNLPSEVLRPSKRLPVRGDRYYLLSDVHRAHTQMQTGHKGT